MEDTTRFTEQGALSAQNKADITKYGLTAVGAGLGAWAGYALANKFAKSKPLFALIGAVVVGGGVFTLGHFTIKSAQFARQIDTSAGRQSDAKTNCLSGGGTWSPQGGGKCTYSSSADGARQSAAKNDCLSAGGTWVPQGGGKCNFAN